MRRVAAELCRRRVLWEDTAWACRGIEAYSCAAMRWFIYLSRRSGVHTADGHDAYAQRAALYETRLSARTLHWTRMRADIEEGRE